MGTIAICFLVFLIGFAIGKAITAHAANKMLKEINDEVQLLTALMEQKLADKDRA